MPGRRAFAGEGKLATKVFDGSSSNRAYLLWLVDRHHRYRHACGGNGVAMGG